MAHEKREEPDSRSTLEGEHIPRYGEPTAEQLQRIESEAKILLDDLPRLYEVMRRGPDQGLLDLFLEIRETVRRATEATRFSQAELRELEIVVSALARGIVAGLGVSAPTAAPTTASTPCENRCINNFKDCAREAEDWWAKSKCIAILSVCYFGCD